MSDPDARLIPGYQPDFDIDSAVGRQGELIVLDLVAALRSGRVEVKIDERAAMTGNVYIEHECLRRGRWQPSGIATTKANLWAFVLGRGVIVAASVEVVSRVHARALAEGRLRETSRGSHPTRGAIVPLTSIVSRCIVESMDLRGTA